jgi:hypothetical protein
LTGLIERYIANLSRFGQTKAISGRMKGMIIFKWPGASPPFRSVLEYCDYITEK